MTQWTIEKIESYCRDLSAKMEDSFDCPVKINGRLTATLGRVCYIHHYADNSDEYTKLELSRQYLETATDECIENVIKHEFCHYLSMKRTGVSHGHDDYFKLLCKQVGCTCDGTSTKVDRLEGVRDEDLYKYGLYCPTCNKLLKGYQRKVKAVQHPEWYKCSICGNDHLYVGEF